MVPSGVAVIVAGGAGISPSVLEEIPEGAWVVAADSGLEHAQSLGLEVHHLIGDMDSVSDDAIRRAGNIPVDRFPTDKEATDLELAMDLVASKPGIDRLIVLGGHGGRLDHLLANANLLASRRWSHLEVEWLAGRARVTVIHDHGQLHGFPGETITLLAFGGPATGVTTTGLQWPLTNETLLHGSSRGVSNTFVRPVVTVGVEEGTVVAIQPD